MSDMPPPPSRPPSVPKPKMSPSEMELFAPVSWEQYFTESEYLPIGDAGHVLRLFYGGSTGPVCFLLHGGGHSSMSWALCAKLLMDHCTVVAFDFRGWSHSADDSDLSVDTLVNETLAVINHVFSSRYQEKMPSCYIIGHSMGGAIAARTAAHIQRPKTLCGVVVIDVVEGTALAALSSMDSILRARPERFPTVEAGIKWALATGQVKNHESAKVSIPPQLKQRPDGGWEWKTNLFESEKYWKGWFTGLSQVFLSVKVPKLLLLAGTDRLDKDLTIAQMQGKFQLVVLPAVGHVIQEDSPDKTASALLEFIKRNLPLVFPKKL